MAIVEPIWATTVRLLPNIAAMVAANTRPAEVTTPPVPAIPLSQLGIVFGLEFAEGEQVKTITIPIAADGVAEAAEGVALRLDGFGDPVVPVPIELTGTVPAN